MTTTKTIAPARPVACACGRVALSIVWLFAGFTGCSSLPKPRTDWNEPRTVDTTNTTWARALAPAVAAHTNESGIGSLNLTPRSSSLNTEMGLVVEIPQLTGPAIESLEKSLAQNAYRLEFVPGPGPCKECGSVVWVSQEEGREVRYQREPHASFCRRLQVGILSLLPLESQL